MKLNARLLQHVPYHVELSSYDTRRFPLLADKWTWLRSDLLQHMTPSRHLTAIRIGACLQSRIEICEGQVAFALP